MIAAISVEESLQNQINSLFSGTAALWSALGIFVAVVGLFVAILGFFQLNNSRQLKDHAKEINSQLDDYTEKINSQTKRNTEKINQQLDEVKRELNTYKLVLLTTLATQIHFDDITWKNSGTGKRLINTMEEISDSLDLEEQAKNNLDLIVVLQNTLGTVAHRALSVNTQNWSQKDLEQFGLSMEQFRQIFVPVVRNSLSHYNGRREKAFKKERLDVLNAFEAFVLDYNKKNNPA